LEEEPEREDKGKNVKKGFLLEKGRGNHAVDRCPGPGFSDSFTENRPWGR
jgi:hypothetical protein